MINEIFNNLSSYVQVFGGLVISLICIKLFAMDKFILLDILHQKLIGKDIKIFNKKLEDVIGKRRDLLAARIAYPEFSYVESAEELLEILECCDCNQIPHEKAKHFKKYLIRNPQAIEKVTLAEIPDQSANIFFSRITHYVVYFLMIMITSLVLFSGNSGSVLIIGKETKATAWLNDDNTATWFNPLTSSKWILDAKNCSPNIETGFSDVETNAICHALATPNETQNFIDNSTRKGNIVFVVFMTLVLPYSIFLRREREKYAALDYYRKQIQQHKKNTTFII